MTSRLARVGALALGATTVSTITLDLDDDSQALELARHFSKQTGRTVAVQNEDGEILGIFRGVVSN